MRPAATEVMETLYALRRLTLFRQDLLAEAVPRCFTPVQLEELLSIVEAARAVMQAAPARPAGG